MVASRAGGARSALRFRNVGLIQNPGLEPFVMHPEQVNYYASLGVRIRRLRTPSVQAANQWQGHRDSSNRRCTSGPWLHVPELQ